MADTRAIGREGEDAAHDYLLANGYRILHRNFKYGRYGEIDIIAQKSGVICFIEVKSRSGVKFGTPAEAVGKDKRKKILTVANHYLRVNGNQGLKLRFDVVEVYFDNTGSKDARRAVREIHLIENAFGA